MHIKEFLIKNEDKIKPLLDKKNFNQVYSLLNKVDASSDMYNCLTSEFTQLMLDLNINPLDYMDHIPPYYLMDRQVSVFNVPKHIKVIGREAFSGSSIKQINIPQDCELSIIENYAFDNCDELTEIELSDNVNEIYSNCFNGCSNLEKIFIPQSVVNIGSYAFAGCPNDIKIVNEGEDNILKAFPTNKYDEIDFHRLGLDELHVEWFHGWPRSDYRNNIWS